jgi:ABC-type oligopeptide transport system ATPase subunit
MSTPLLEANNITVKFGDMAECVCAVDNASLYVNSREAVGVVGESGSGKTTLARVLIGLQQPSKGAVYLEGQQISSVDRSTSFPNSERWKIQMVFQDPYSSLNPRMRAVSTVAEAVKVWHEIDKESADEKALKILGSVGISKEQALQFPRSLSGGQRQRVSMARALVPNPKILVADEPTSSIDQSAQAQLLNLLQNLRKEVGLSIIFISHDLSLIRYLTTRVYVMQKGKIVESGDTARVFDHPEHPYTKILIDSIPGSNLDNH